MRIAPGGWIWILGGLGAGAAAGMVARCVGWEAGCWAAGLGGVVVALFMAYFHRDPVRQPPPGEENIVAGADGWVRRVDRLTEGRHLNAEAVRISVFLSPFDVHVNRAPLSGQVVELGYTPGQRLFTICNAASERNEHSTIVIEGQGMRCLVKQIVGPFVRRVVYWLGVGQSVARGERIGMMRFGSRLDMYLPAAEVEVLVRPGDRVRAGQSVVARRLRRQDA